MKRLKALIKVEIKPALLIGILFLIVNLLGFIQIQSSINGIWKSYLMSGIAGYFNYYRLINIIGRIIFEASLVVGILYMMLLIALVFSSFRYEKSIEVSRFLKSLPYTERERCFVKVGTGIMTLTIGIMVYLVEILYLHHYSRSVFQEIMDVTSLGSIAQEIFSLGKLLKIVALIYVVLIAGYLFMVMVQYMVSNRLTGIVIGILSAFAPLFILNSVIMFFDISWDSWIGKIVDVFTYLMIHFVDYADINWNPDSYIGRYAYVSGFGYHIAFYLGIITLIVMAILYFTRTNRLENSDLLMPHSVVRMIFIAGVSVCGGFTIYYLSSLFSNYILFRDNVAPRIVILIVGAVISALIAKKIAYIGIKKRKEVKA